MTTSRPADRARLQENGSKAGSRIGHWVSTVLRFVIGRCQRRRGARAPYYIIAPPYDERSAGNRVLYELASRLRTLGEDAFVAIHDQWEPVWAAVPARYDVVCLTPAMAARHHRGGRAPICIYPETTRHPADCGLRVLYLLNHLGAMNESARIRDYDYVVSYSTAIARGSIRSDLTMHLPVSDADFWSPDPHARRSGAAAYAGKYVDVHGQTLPTDLADAFIIHRQGLGAPTRWELRDLFRTSTHLYVFESTALATEAVLCGCPVVYRTNAFFEGHVGEEELSLAGFTRSDHPKALAEAAAATAQFRANYGTAIAAGDAALHVFVRETQAAASLVACSSPFPVRPLQSGEAPFRSATGRFFRASSRRSDGHNAIVRHEPGDRDIRFSYWLFLAREPESIDVVAAKRGLSPLQLASVLLSSEEFTDRIVGPVCAGRDVAVAAIGRKAMAELQAWSSDALPLCADALTALRASLSWHQLLLVVVSDARFRRKVASKRSEWRNPRFCAALSVRVEKEFAAREQDRRDGHS